MAAAGKLDAMYRYLSGESEDLKNTQIDLVLFPRVWWPVFDTANSYLLKLKQRDGKVIERRVKPVAAMEYETEGISRPSFINSSRSFRYVNEVAYLHPGVFLNNESGSNALAHEGGWKKEPSFVSLIPAFWKYVQKKQPV